LCINKNGFGWVANEKKAYASKFEPMGALYTKFVYKQKMVLGG
jgi:5-methylcytosine-specific restriction endonuclease McrBC regulatory subunit McrC